MIFLHCPGLPYGFHHLGSGSFAAAAARRRSCRSCFATDWDTAFIRRFMTFFGPISSIFDFATFGIMIWVFHAHAPLFRSGWFVESLATQCLIIFAIRTRRVPFFHRRPSTPLAVATMICVAIGVLLPFSPLAHVLGFVALPVSCLATLAVMVVIYLVLVELGKLRFYRVRRHGPPVARRRPEREHWIHHRDAVEHPRPPAPPNARPASLAESDVAATSDDATRSLSGAFPVRPRGLEPPRTIKSTRPSTLRVYQFRHRRWGRPV